MWRVAADGAGMGPQNPVKARVKSALGALAMHHIGLQLPDQPRDQAENREIPHIRIAMHRQAMEPERQMGFELGQQRVAALASGHGIADDPDRVPARDEALHQIIDMPEQAAHRGAESQQDAQGALGFGHGLVLPACLRSSVP